MNGIFEIRLKVEWNDAGFRARWTSVAGGASEPFNLDIPWTLDEAADLRWYLEEFRGFVGAGTRVKARAVERQLEEWGCRLFDACFGGPQSAKALEVLKAAMQADRPLTLSLASDESFFHQRPWELMRNANGPLAFQGVSIRRQLVSEQSPRPSRPEAPLRLLLIVARPNDTDFLDPRSSQGPLLDALEKIPNTAVQLHLCQPPTLARLEEMIEAARANGRPFHIVHFDGHGTFLPRTGVGVVCFEKNDRNMHMVAGCDFGKLLAGLEIPLAILEACRTSSFSDAPVHGSVATALLASGVGSVVAFSHNVSLEASRLLVERFYRELVAGRSVGQSVARAREALRSHPQRRVHAGRNAATVEFEDWFLPQFYQSGADPVLVAGTEAIGAVTAKSRAEEGLHGGFPPQPMYPFQGRAWELLQMERAFEKLPAVLLAGGGGMGKTALAREAALWWLRTGRFEMSVLVSFEQVTTVERIVQELGQAFEGVAFSVRSAEDQQKVALQLFRDNRVLLIWDNFESTLPQFQRGEEGGIVAYPEEERARLLRFYEAVTDNLGEGRLLVTCRPSNTSLPGIGQLSLGGLARLDSLLLLQSIVDFKAIVLERKGWEREEVEKLVGLLGDHPLSISLVGPHLEKLEPAKICADFARLLDQFVGEHEEEKNRSLRASLSFSTSRLSASSRAVLPFLVWFSGGAFENIVLAFAQLTPEEWSPVRAELEETALLTVEELPGFLVPFLRFHPTLPYAARRDGVGDLEGAEDRFIAIYLDVIRQIDGIFQAENSRDGQLLAEREELNLRSSLEIAFHLGGAQQACRELAGTLENFLQMTGRFRERDQLTDWVQAQMTPSHGSLNTAERASIQQYALSLASRGRASEAATQLSQLIARLEAEDLRHEELLLDLGASYSFLGLIWANANKPSLALAPCLRAIDILEKLSDEFAQDRLAGALGSLANACRVLGRPEEALEAAERGLAIDRKLGRERNVAAGLGQCAAILAWQQRWPEAEKLYREVLKLALRLGDLELQAITLQNQGGLQDDQGHPSRAVELYQQAILFFQRAENSQGEMRTYSLLATAERRRGEFDAAEAWYVRARELADQLADQHQVAEIAHNLGILYQDRAEKAASPEVSRGWLRRSLNSLQQSLQIELKEDNQIGAAKTLFQKGVVHRLLGDFDSGEKASQEALRIQEGLDDPETWKIYQSLAEIAAARGDIPAAEKWSVRSETSRAEIEKRHGYRKVSVPPCERLDNLKRRINPSASRRWTWSYGN